MNPTLHGVAHELQHSFREYIEATYHIADLSLMEQRRRALDAVGVIHQVPFLESTPRYQTGAPFEKLGLHVAATQALCALIPKNEHGKHVLFDPPYTHQADALVRGFGQNRNLVIMTGTGSGKTESFLMPTLAKLAREAHDNASSFAVPAVRTMVLYPMNALVNDQLSRLRAIFGDPRVGALFQGWAGRPPRFARYTSRTPYAGLRNKDKDSRHLKQFGHFYVSALNEAVNGRDAQRTEAQELLKELRSRGKWPAKPDIAKWFGRGPWQDRQGQFIRAVTLPQDSELLTRHEVQEAPPDVLVTNYSMLEYMLMRPVERGIFDKTAAWLAKSRDATFTLILDEAHLYRGAGGTEVGLLLRRLRDRLGVAEEKFRVVCSTASFSERTKAVEFAAQLTGLDPSTFDPIEGKLKLQGGERTGTNEEAALLASISLDAVHSADEQTQITATSPLIASLGGKLDRPVPEALHDVLKSFGPLALLINQTMKQALPVAELPAIVFPQSPATTAGPALAVLATLATLAKPEPDAANLLPSRIHTFFRGLQGLWVCMNPQCSGRPAGDGAVAGCLYTQPTDRCMHCQSLVFELYTCRLCGTAYARAYSPTPDDPHALWVEPGARLDLDGDSFDPLSPVDLLLSPPRDNDSGIPAELDLVTGELNSAMESKHARSVWRAPPSNHRPKGDDDDDEPTMTLPGLFAQCGACGRAHSRGPTPVQDHETKGDEPLKVLVSRQIQLQPPGPQPATSLAPLRGRKVLVFSDSRQVAARLAPSLQLHSARDAVRAALAVGWQILLNGNEPLSLDDLFAATVVGANMLKVRLRPELQGTETFGVNERIGTMINQGTLDRPGGIAQILREASRSSAPRALLADILQALRNRLVGLESLAVASIAESSETHERLENDLPDLPGMTTNFDERLGVVRAWLREWRRQGYRVRDMPQDWLQTGGGGEITVSTRGKAFQKFVKRLPTDAAKRIFKKEWIDVLIAVFCENVAGKWQLQGSRLTLNFGDGWVRCEACKTPQRPFPGVSACLECGAMRLVPLTPASDPYFDTRKGFYRRPIVEALRDHAQGPLALIAAEHTAQLNAAQHEDVFSKGERNELLFQDVALTVDGETAARPAIDVLSSTTTMEVGIDIGQLSGVALRNMPPARANYQQRAGRAGRRANAVASVVAYSGSDTHDEHFFSTPAEMISGDVIDPKLSLHNPGIAVRHIRAFLLQAYLQARVLQPTSVKADLFSVLGTVGDFLKPTNPINRQDLELFLRNEEETLRARAARILPEQIPQQERNVLLDSMIDDLLTAVDAATQGAMPNAPVAPVHSDGEPAEAPPEPAETRPTGEFDPAMSLLDRLLYKGILPRYAFPTDVATFHVFKPSSPGYFPEFEYLPSQGMVVALSQYAPGKQVWIDGRLYSSRAIYSQMWEDRRAAWVQRRVHAECTRCGYALLAQQDSGLDTRSIRDCPACRGHNTLGPAKWWVRPPGFAHPIDVQPTVTPEDAPETSYATRAKLTLDSSSINNWNQPNPRVRVITERPHLLVTNSGPAREGYTYCRDCGRIESHRDPQASLATRHLRPYPDEQKPHCDGDASSTIVLGTDFISDVALFSFVLGDGVRLSPANTLTSIALRTLSEALSQAATSLLELEPGEIVAEYRAAVTEQGVLGNEAELFLYDTLPGGAGFSQQAVETPLKLLAKARTLMASCKHGCDRSCYRCLRNFRNRHDHAYLDRHVGIALVDYLLDGHVSEFNPKRLEDAATILANELERHVTKQVNFTPNAVASGSIEVTSLHDRRIVQIGHPLQLPDGTRIIDEANEQKLLISELIVRSHLPRASVEARKWLGL